MNTENYKEVLFTEGTDLDSAIELLQKEKELGNNAYGMFRGVKLSTDNLIVDDIYKVVTGKTKEEFDKDFEVLLKNYAEEKRRNHEVMERIVEERIPYWIETGHQLFPEELWEQWDEIVPIRAKDVLHGMELDIVISVQLIILEDKEHLFEEIKKLPMEKDTLLFYLSCLLIKAFCENGDEIVEYLEK